MDLNRYIATGNLTQDPELHELPSGTSVCQLRIATNGLGRGDREAVGYLNVNVYGTPGENCARYLSKGRMVAVDGRLEYHEWKTDEGKSRSAIEVIANTVKFLGARDASAVPADDELASVSSNTDDDIAYLHP